jgi:hypothetical protein
VGSGLFACGSSTVGETTNASPAAGSQLCAVRPYNILELALHGVPSDVVEVLLARPHDEFNIDRAASALIQPGANKIGPLRPGPATVTFWTPTSGRRCLLNVVGGVDRWSVARFSTVWTSGGRRLPSALNIRRWNSKALVGQSMVLRDDGSIILRMDADLDDVTLQQVIPLWLRWDRHVEAAREFIVYGVV